MSRHKNPPLVLWRGQKANGQSVDMKEKCSPDELEEQKNMYVRNAGQ